VATPSLVDRLTQVVTQTEGGSPQEEDDDDIIEPSSPIGTLEYWQRGITTSHALGKQLIVDYPAWLSSQFQDRVSILPGAKQRIMISIDDRWVQTIRINDRKGAEVWLTSLTHQQVGRLREQLSQPQSLAQKPSQLATYPNHWRFNIETPGDIDLCKELMVEIAATRQPAASPMSIADAAYTGLARAGGGPLHLSDILKQIQDADMATMRGQTPQLSLASIMLRDERFQNLGRNTWIFASTQDTDDSEDESTLTNDPTPEPPTRKPNLYADDDAQFWRIHFPRELWVAARRFGVIGISWPIDASNQSVKRFQKIQPGDRVVAYVQGGLVGGIGVATRGFDPANPTAGLAADAISEEYNQYIRIAGPMFQQNRLIC
jgi:hypothetical protein